MDLSIPENCEEIHTGDYFSESLFHCIRCNDEYYLGNNNFCLERINKTDNCK